MKKLLTLGLCVLIPTLVAGDLSQDEIRNQLQTLQSQITELKAQLNAQQETVKTEVETAVERSFAQVKNGGGLSLGPNIDGLMLTGDLMLRYERQEWDWNGPEGELERLRTRLRLGGIWQNSTESWEVGVGAVTGANFANTAEDTWSDVGPFDTGNLSLDYAYAKHTMDCFSLTLGQQMNPFKASWLLWDEDVRPAGITGQYSMDMFFATLGAYEVQNVADDLGNGSMLYAGQIGGKMETEEFNAMLALAYYWYNESTRDVLVGWADEDYEFNVGSIYGEAGTRMGDVGVKLYGEVFSNFGAEGAGGQLGVITAGYEADDGDMGYVVGIEGSFQNFSLGYAWASLEADAAPGALTDRDFGNDADGHIITLGYDVTKNCSIGLEIDLTDSIEQDDLEWDLYQLDLTYKF